MKLLQGLFQAILIVTGITVVWWLLSNVIEWMFTTIGIEGIALVTGVSAVGVYATASKDQKAATAAYIKEQFPEVEDKK